MKKIVIAIFLLVFTIVAFAQNVELQIRDLENTEHQAMMVQDTATLSTLLAKDIIVTTPLTKLFRGGIKCLR